MGPHSLASISHKVFDGEMTVNISEDVKGWASDERGSSKSKPTGTFYLTNYRIFHDAQEYQIDIALATVRSIYGVSTARSAWNPFANPKPMKGQITAKSNFEQVDRLIIYTKLLQVFCFDLRRVKERKKLIASLLHFAFPQSSKQLFAHDAPRYTNNESQAREEFLRQVRQEITKEMARCKVNRDVRFSLSEANSEFTLCRSYPPLVVVPANASDDMISASADLWADNRFPVWSYSHPQTGAWICRASTQQSSHADPILDVLASRCGKYRVISTGDCPTGTLVKQSFEKMYALCTTTKGDSGFLGGLHASKWLYYVHQILDISVEGVKALQDNESILILSKTRMDMDCIISSLTQIMIDPFCRTIEGFESLITKEWVAMGHRFRTRYSHVPLSPSKESPMFLLFLDAVHQLIRKYPISFEYSEGFLRTMWYHTLSSLHPLFLFDNHYDRLQEAVLFSGPQIWTFMHENNLFGEQHTNPVYRRREAPLDQYLPLASLFLWKEFFCPHSSGTSIDDVTKQYCQPLVDRIEELRAAIAQKTTRPPTENDASEAGSSEAESSSHRDDNGQEREVINATVDISAGEKPPKKRGEESPELVAVARDVGVVADVEPVVVVDVTAAEEETLTFL